MKWFGRKAARVAARPFLLRHGMAPGAGEWPRSYEAQVWEAYLGNPVAQRAVRLVAEGCAGASVYDAGDRAGGELPPPASPVPQASPCAADHAPGMTSVLAPVPGRIVTASLLEAVATHLLLHGNAFVQVICDAGGVPAELFPLRPERVPGQAQKELHHNEALARIDALLHACVEGPPLSAPPAAPQEGQCWIVAVGATGEWAGRDRALAAWTSGGWRFVDARPGMAAWSIADGHWIHFDGAEWSGGTLPVAAIEVGGQQVVGARQSAILNPSGGTIIDAEARQTIGQITAALMSHGLIG